MKYQELLILLPCHSLEDFPTYHEGDDASSLLASWTAMWHPALIASAQALPTWCRADTPPADLTDRLLIVPTVSHTQLPTGFAQRAKDAGATLIRRHVQRPEIIQEALEPLPPASELDPEIALDFLALGYCYLQVQLLTRQMRYSSNLDDLQFRNQAVAGATSAVAGDHAAAREKLLACFNLLSQERDHYYPVTAYLIDLTLVAPTTFGLPLKTELDGGTPLNVVLSASTLEQMVSTDSQAADTLIRAWHNQTVGLIGSEPAEPRLPLMSLESVAAELNRGQHLFERLANKLPIVYGRRRFGLTPFLPQVLHKLGFQAAWHSTLDDGRFPQGSQFKIRWEGLDGTAVDAIARVPMDAAKPQTFLSLAAKLGESMDADQVATLSLAHWPDHASPWYADLRRVARYTAALGKFVTVEHYFGDTDMPGQMDRFDASQYRAPYLKQAIIRKQLDPISVGVRYWRARMALQACETISALTSLISGGTPPDFAELAREVDEAAEDAEAQLEPLLRSTLDKHVQDFAAVLPRAAEPAAPGVLVVNPMSCVRRCGIQGSEIPQTAPGRPVYAAAQQDQLRQVVVDVPPMGFVWLREGTAPPGPAKSPLLVEDNVLRNEFFEAVINPTTGSLQSFREYNARTNRISQQLAFRLPVENSADDESSGYSVMAAESLTVTAASTAYGEIVSRGQLLDRRGRRLAGFSQKYQLWRGSRVLLVDLQLDPQVEPEADPWNSYFGCRFAWSDETAQLWRTVHECRQRVGSRQFEAPHYIEIETEPSRTTIFTGGLPFHRRAGDRMLDSLLIVRGERAREFRIGLGMDVVHPLPEALALLSPRIILPQSAAPPAPAHFGWLFHIDARHVLATHWQALRESDRVCGFRTRILEAAGQPGRVTLTAFRPVANAQQVDFRGRPLGNCQVEDGKIRLDLAAYEWACIEGRW